MKEKRFLFLFCFFAVFLYAVLGLNLAFAAGPLEVTKPYWLKAYVTVDGVQLTGVNTSYSIKVKNTNGTEFQPADTTGTTFGTPIAGRFSYNIPTYDSADQPQGAKTGEVACIELYHNSAKLNVSYPAQGSCPAGSGQIIIGNYGDAIGFGGPPGTDDSQTFATPITATTPVTPCSISVAPTSHDFQSVRTGQTSATQTFTVSNSGTAACSVGTIALGGTNPGDFQMGNNGCAAQLAGKSNCTVDVAFKPTAEGSRAATLNVPWETTNTATASLTGIGTASALVVNPAGDYGTVNQDTSLAKTFTVTNSGSASTTIASVAVSGTDAAQFVKSVVAGEDTCTGATVPASGTCTVKITFTPASAGAKAATLTISSNDLPAPVTHALSGTGTSGIDVSPVSLQFGNVQIGRPKDMTITVANTGNLDLTVASVQLAGHSGFSIKTPIPAGTVIPAGGQAQTMTVTFSAGQVETAAGTVIITSNNATQPTITVNLSAAGVEIPIAEIAISPAGPVTFADKDVEDTAAYEKKAIEVRSTGDIDLHIGTVVLSDPANYTITSDTCSDKAIPAGSGCALDVQFNPKAVGLKEATVTIPSNDGNEDATINKNTTVALTGRGIHYGLNVTPDSLNFGMILLPDNTASGYADGCVDNNNGTVSCAVTVQNTGTEPLSNVILSTGQSPFTVDPTAIASLTGGASEQATVTYTSGDGKTAVDQGTLAVSSGSYNAEVILAGVTNTRPDTPVNSSPEDEATTGSLTPVLKAGDFSDVDGDTHKSSTWQISTDQAFGKGTVTITVVKSADATVLTSVTVPANILKQDTTYYWRVIYTDNRNGPSLPSTATSFRTPKPTPATAMSTSGTTLDTLAVKSGTTEVTTLTQASSVGNICPKLLEDAISSGLNLNSGTNADSTKPGVAIVKEKGDTNSKDILGIVTPAGTVIDEVRTYSKDDAVFSAKPPESYTFPDGVVQFKVIGVTPGAPVTINIYTPAGLPSGAVWYKYTAALGWVMIDGAGIHMPNGTVSADAKFTVDAKGIGTLTIKDDGVADGLINALIDGRPIVLDPGAPAVLASTGPEPTPQPTPTPTSDSGGGSGGGGGCFIATAAFGSYFSPYVAVLRNFRDTFLIPSTVGKSFVRWYYRVSPPIAETISKNEALKAGVRAALLPAVGFSSLCLAIGLLPAALLMLLIVTGMAGAVAYGFRHRKEQH